MIDELCKRWVDKNAHNKDGMTPLHVAVDQNLEECVRLLICNGANVNVQVRGSCFVCV